VREETIHYSRKHQAQYSYTELAVNKKETISESTLWNRVNRYAGLNRPCPTEEVHRLAMAAEEYEGIEFTNINGNIITDQGTYYDEES